MCRAVTVTRLKKWAAAAVVICGFATEAQAAPILQIDGSGQLTGARNVDLGALGLFDVAFVDGSCNSLFNNCDQRSFDFTTVTDAAAAAQALLDQVFVDGLQGFFGSDPTTIFGCSSDNSCQPRIPYNTGTTHFIYAGPIIRGTAPGPNNVRDRGITFKFADMTTDSVAVFANFSPASTISVPEPGSLALFGFGLAGLSFMRRRRAA